MMELSNYSKLSEIIREARFQGKITPEEADEMRKHIIDDDPLNLALHWKIGFFVMFFVWLVTLLSVAFVLLV